MSFPLIYSSSTRKVRSQAKLTSQTRNSVWSRVGVAGIQTLKLSPAASQCTHQQEAKMEIQTPSSMVYECLQQHLPQTFILMKMIFASKAYPVTYYTWYIALNYMSPLMKSGVYYLFSTLTLPPHQNRCVKIRAYDFMYILDFNKSYMEPGMQYLRTIFLVTDNQQRQIHSFNDCVLGQ